MSKHKAPKFKQWEALAVEWVDSQGYDGWSLTRDAEQPPKSLGCRTVGLLYQATEDHLSIVLSVADIGERGEQYNGCITIPRVAITAIHKLEEAV